MKSILAHRGKLGVLGRSTLQSQVRSTHSDGQSHNYKLNFRGLIGQQHSHFTFLHNTSSLLTAGSRSKNAGSIAVCQFSTSRSRNIEKDDIPKGKAISLKKSYDENETHGQPLHTFGSSHKREQASTRFDVLNQETNVNLSGNYQQDVAAKHHMDVYNHTPSVNLSSCMQSQVPQPYGRNPPHMNMPGGSNRLEDKYVQGRLSDISGKREFSTHPRGSATPTIDEHGNLMYTLESDMEWLLHGPCPQGVQGEDCEQFKLWLSNCLQHGDSDECEQLANEYIAGRKTLVQVFLQYDLEIKKVVADISAARAQQVGTEHTLPFSSTTGNFATPLVGDNPSSSSSPDDGKHSRKSNRVARLKAAVRDYGSIVVVFHIGIALTSLGIFYTLVASNIDVLSILKYFNISLGSAQSSVEAASTFAVAYAVHKVFAPVRIGITLTCAPLIVRSLRARGILKTPPPRPPK